MNAHAYRTAQSIRADTSIADAFFCTASLSGNASFSLGLIVSLMGGGCSSIIDF